jgi:uncharacterized Zn finger protein
MQKLEDHLTTERLKALARPSNIKYGAAIYKRGGVEIISKEPNKVEAKVGGLEGSVSEGGSQRRRTTLELVNGTLQWHCTESAKPDLLFCKHCVALALALQ